MITVFVFRKNKVIREIKVVVDDKTTVYDNALYQLEIHVFKMIEILHRDGLEAIALESLPVSRTRIIYK
jgi:hypothetical protein